MKKSTVYDLPTDPSVGDIFEGKVSSIMQVEGHVRDRVTASGWEDADGSFWVLNMKTY